MPSMLINGPSSYYPIRNPMDHRIIRVRFQKKWRPIEFNRRIILLYNINFQYHQSTFSKSKFLLILNYNKLRIIKYLGGEDSEGIEGLHGLGVVGN